MLDEHTALQLAFSSLEDKLRGVQVSITNTHVLHDHHSVVLVDLRLKFLFNKYYTIFILKLNVFGKLIVSSRCLEISICK